MRYYHHPGMAPYPFDWQGYAQPGARSHGSLRDLGLELDVTGTGTLRYVAAGALAYHGYKRHGTALAAGIWAVAGLVSPLIGGVVAAVQGFAKKKG